MSWDMSQWEMAGDTSCLGTIATDGTSLLGESWLCTVCDDITFPVGWTLRQKIDHDWSELFTRRYEVLCMLGYGEGGRTHKALALRHQSALRGGAGKGLENFRWSRMASISDQGTERKLWDLPDLSALHGLDTATLDLPNAIPNPNEASEYMWPRMVSWTGPLHIIFNALKTHSESSPHWDTFQQQLRAVLSVLGNKGALRRFLALSSLDSSTRSAMSHFHHRVVDWKWEYMEDLFLDLEPFVPDFFRVFNAKAMRAASGMEGSVQVLDPKGMKLLEDIQQGEVEEFAANVSGFAMLFRAVGKLGRWMKGCDCHEAVWQALDATMHRKSRQRKFAQHMLAETKNRCSSCWRVGRRASSLARGHFIPLIKDLSRCSSKLFTSRLGSLPLESRNRVLHRVTTMATKIEEELLEKFSYHQTIPHMIAGVWPLDSESPRVAQQCLQQYDGEEHMKSHRVSIRMLDKGSHLGRRMAILAQGGTCSVELEFELKAMNLAATTEQYLEAVHAESKNLLVGGKGKTSHEVLSVRVRRRQTMRSLNKWDAKLFGAERWSCHSIAKDVLLKTGIPKAFCEFAKPAELIRAIHFNHDRQLFSHCQAVSDVADHWDASSLRPKAFISQDEKLALQWFKDRLADSIVSLPAFAASAAAVHDESKLVVADNIVDGAIVAATSDTTREEQLVTAEVQQHTFYKIVNADLSSRYYHNDKDFHKFVCVCAVVYSLDCAGPAGVWTLRPHSGSVDRTAFFSKTCAKKGMCVCTYTCICMFSMLYRIDLLQCLREVGFSRLSTSMVIWDGSMKSKVSLSSMDHRAALLHSFSTATVGDAFCFVFMNMREADIYSCVCVCMCVCVCEYVFL